MPELYDHAPQVSRPITRVVPITLCAEWGPVHNLLRGYKDGPEELRARFLPRVAALLARFVDEHGKCIGHWETVTAVPSSKGRPAGSSGRIQRGGPQPVAASSDREFTFERCCLCDPPWPEG